MSKNHPDINDTLVNEGIDAARARADSAKPYDRTIHKPKLRVLNGGGEKRQQRGEDWRDGLILTPTKNPKKLLANIITALRGAPEWEGVLAHDEFALNILALTPPPWAKGHNHWVPRVWGDSDDTLATNWMHHQKIPGSVTEVHQAIGAVAKDHNFHPVRDYLEGLKWDGVKRLHHFATKYLGAEDIPYHRRVAECFMISACARIMKPGCKVDHVPILESDQGEGKSTFCHDLFFPFFTDEISEFGSKDASQQVCGVWGIEVAELAAMSRGDIEKTKAFITRRTDRFRPSYGRYVIEVPRQCVFIATTNSETYLKDETGARRFWPLKCGTLDLATLRRDRDQLWAEAMEKFKAGTPWWLTNPADMKLARDEQANRYVQDAWTGPIAAYLDGREEITVGEVLWKALTIEESKWTKIDQSRVGQCLRHLGWVMVGQGPRPRRERIYRLRK